MMQADKHIEDGGQTHFTSNIFDQIQLLTTKICWPKNKFISTKYIDPRKLLTPKDCIPQKMIYFLIPQFLFTQIFVKQQILTHENFRPQKDGDPQNLMTPKN